MRQSFAYPKRIALIISLWIKFPLPIEEFQKNWVIASGDTRLQEVYDDAKKSANEAHKALNDLSLGKGEAGGRDKINNILKPNVIENSEDTEEKSSKENTDNNTGNSNKDERSTGSINKDHNESILKNIVEQGAKRKEQEDDLSKCTRDNCNTSSVTGTRAMSDRDTKLDLSGFKKDSEGFAKNTKGYIDTAKERIKEYTQKYDPISKVGQEYKDCKAESNETIPKNKEECDEYYDARISNCPAIEAVEIDSKYTYRCQKIRDEVLKTCIKEVKSIKCKAFGECDSGGVILSSIASDMKWEYQYPYLILGTIADNYWLGNCDAYDRTTNFIIKNKDNIKEFKITQTGFDDYLWIKVNGITVYVGPYGGNKLDIVTRKMSMNSFIIALYDLKLVDDGNGIKSCELNTNHQVGVNIDLLPYLKEGINNIWIRVIVKGKGEGWMKIYTKQHCCKEWAVEEQDVCKYDDELYTNHAQESAR